MRGAVQSRKWDREDSLRKNSPRMGALAMWLNFRCTPDDCTAEETRLALRFLTTTVNIYAPDISDFWGMFFRKLTTKFWQERQ